VPTPLKEAHITVARMLGNTSGLCAAVQKTINEYTGGLVGLYLGGHLHLQRAVQRIDKEYDMEIVEALWIGRSDYGWSILSDSWYDRGNRCSSGVQEKYLLR
jgi:hypothetical protein